MFVWFQPPPPSALTTLNVAENAVVDRTDSVVELTRTATTQGIASRCRRRDDGNTEMHSHVNEVNVDESEDSEDGATGRSSALWCVLTSHVFTGFITDTAATLFVPSFSEHTYDIPLREALFFVNFSVRTTLCCTIKRCTLAYSQYGDYRLIHDRDIIMSSHPFPSACVFGSNEASSRKGGQKSCRNRRKKNRPRRSNPASNSEQRKRVLRRRFLELTLHRTWTIHSTYFHHFLPFLPVRLFLFLIFGFFLTT